MHAFLIHQSPDLPDSPDILKILPNPSIGIEEVRQIQKFLSRKPIRDDKNTVIVNQAHLLTIPAQNALLKTLEEPPGNSLVYLITSSPYSLLPTVLSRVQITDLPNPPNLPDHPDLSKSLALFSKLQKVGIGERLKILDEAALDRLGALQFLNDLESIIHEQLRVTPFAAANAKGVTLFDLIINTRTYLKANCSVKLCLDNFVINLTTTTPSVPS